MYCTRLCGSILKDVYVLRGTSGFLLQNARQTTYRSNYRNFFNSKITLQKANPYFNNYQANSTRNYIVAGLFVALGMAYAAVPLYRVFCQSTGYGGTVQHDISGTKMKDMAAIKNRKIKVTFNSDVSSSLAWNFRPQQHDIEVYPGETALAFFTATNPTEKPITGISTYNVLPFEAGVYFNKIQCFCFEEQRLNPNEQVDMPVFFYIDPEFVDDPRMMNVDELILSYTFFEAKPGMKFQFPSYAKK